MADITQQFKNMTTRQKATVGVFIFVVILIIWQLYGLLFGGSSSTPAISQQKPLTGNTNVVSNAPMQPRSTSLHPPAPKQAPMSPREMELVKLQQETQAKYLSAVNELQMLKVERELAETNQAIAAAKLATVTSEKNIVTLLAPPAQLTPEAYANGLVNAGSTHEGGVAVPQQRFTAPQQSGAAMSEVNYTVISVSQLQRKWQAVLGYSGNLYNVTIDDILPDGSKVISINRSSVMLEKNSAKKKISLVPLI